jgi:RNA polymerase sigma-70 factor (ECF subfamily)
MAVGGRPFEIVLQAAKDGIEWAWAAIYRDLAGPVRGYFASRGAIDPDDLTGDVFLRIARAIGGFEGDERAFRSWVFVIAHRRLLDERRQLARRPPPTDLPTDDSAGIPVGDVEQEALDRATTTELRHAFDRLTAGQRDVLALRIIAGLSLEDTAKVLGVRVGAVKALQRRALRAIRTILYDDRVSR